MNTPERNEKNVRKMQELGRVYSESDEDKLRESRENSALENATREYPLPTARRFSQVLCGAAWLLSFGGLLFGAIDLRVVMPLLFFALGLMTGLHLPVFYAKKEMLNVIIGAIFTFCCIMLGVTLLVR